MQEDLIKKAAQYIANTYTRFPIAISRERDAGSGMSTGGGTSISSQVSLYATRHAHEKVVEGLTAQAKKLFHVSNSSTWSRRSRPPKCSSRTPSRQGVFLQQRRGANEAAIKLARRYSWNKYGEGRHEIISMENSFHGRTVNTHCCNGPEEVRRGFEPLTQWFHSRPVQ